MEMDIIIIITNMVGAHTRFPHELPDASLINFTTGWEASKAGFRFRPIARAGRLYIFIPSLMSGFWLGSDLYHVLEIHVM